MKLNEITSYKFELKRIEKEWKKIKAALKTDGHT